MSPRRLPRDLDPEALVRALRSKLGYEIVRQTGSHLRIRTLVDGEYHETIPRHGPLTLGTLNAILRNVAAHHRMDRDQLLELLEL